MIIERPSPVKIIKEGKFGSLTKKEFREKLEVENLIKRTTEAKTFKGWLVSSIKVAKQTDNKEMEVFLNEVLAKYNEYADYKKQPVIELEILQGWKGHDCIEIFDGFTNDFIIVSHIKEKHTGEVTTNRHTIPHENVNRILFFIKKWKINESHMCYDFAEVLGQKDWKEVWKKRTDVYFPLYYFPIKILEKIGIIKYGGRGRITRLK